MSVLIRRTRIWVLLLSALAIAFLAVSCGRSHSGTTAASSAVGAPLAAPRQGRASTAPTIPLQTILAQIDAYPVPKGVSAERWSALTAALKRELIARSKDGKTISIAPAGSMNAVTDLAAAPNAAGTQASVTWTDVLAGDYNNDGAVDIGDLAPMAQYYGLDITTGPDDGHRLVNANDGNPQIDIDDLQPIANDYSAHLQGYVVWRGHFNGATTDWETTPRPNPNTGNPDWSADRPSPPPVSTRPAYMYTDDLSGVTDKANVRYKVVAYGDGAAGAESNEATMPAPPTFNVSGTVTQGAAGLAGVTMTLTPGGLSAPTATDGTYTIPNVPNGSYTLTPTLTGYSFAPATKAVDVSGTDMPGQDFVGSPLAHSVSGTVLSAGTGLPGVTMTLTPGGLSATTDILGAFTIPGVANGSYTITPSKAKYIFAPVSRFMIVAGADVVGESFAGTPVFNVSGIVLDNTMGGLPGVTMTLTPGGQTATTGADGTYTIADVLVGGYTLTPSLAGYVFSPASRPVAIMGADVSGQNFVGAPKHSISGTVTDAATSTGLADVTMTLTPGGLTVATAPDGTYTFSDMVDGAYTLMPTKSGYWFAPTSRQPQVSGADVTGQDFTATVAGVASSPWPKFRHDATGTGQSQYVGAQTGTLKWSDATGSSVYGSPAVGADGTVYVGSLDGYVYALDGSTGSLKWSRGTSGGVLSSPAIAADGTVFIGSQPGRVYALNPGDGSPRWTQTTGDIAHASPAIGADGTVYIGSLDDRVYALSPLDGSVKWTRLTGDWIQSTPAIGADGTIYVASEDDNVYALNPADGSVKWTFKTGSWVDSSPAVGADGTIYVGSGDKNVYAVNPGDGSMKWSYTTGSAIFGSPAVGSDGTVYVGSGDSSVYALNPTDGSVKWTHATGNAIVSSPAIGADGLVYIGSEDASLYALNPADGSVKWSYATGADVESSPAIGADGTIYVGSDDYNVYAFGP